VNYSSYEEAGQYYEQKQSPYGNEYYEYEQQQQQQYPQTQAQQSIAPVGGPVNGESSKRYV
jgi:hypothetical protein